ncbi:hypothetical protein IMZ48_25690, partial [Candidatus Bathyarchaeota archaeon]|nr:hypothetical protein [Candidatus Bathyarchaeota archaeon]
MSGQVYQAMQSPPLTPSGTGGHSDAADKHSQHSAYTTDVPSLREPHMITPQHSSSVDEASEPHARTVAH